MEWKEMRPFLAQHRINKDARLVVFEVEQETGSLFAINAETGSIDVYDTQMLKFLSWDVEMGVRADE